MHTCFKSTITTERICIIVLSIVVTLLLLKTSLNMGRLYIQELILALSISGGQMTSYSAPMMLHQLSHFRSDHVVLLRTPSELLNPEWLKYLSKRNIDIWLIIQAALADALDEPHADGPMVHFHGVITALAYRAKSLVTQGYVSSNDANYHFTENDATVVSNCFQVYFDYMSSVLFYNKQLYIDLKATEYRLFLTDTALILDY